MESVHINVNSIPCTVYIIPCTVYIIPCTVYTIPYTYLLYPVYSIFYTYLYSEHYTLYHAHSTLYSLQYNSIQCTPHSLHATSQYHFFTVNLNVYLQCTSYCTVSSSMFSILYKVPRGSRPLSLITL